MPIQVDEAYLHHLIDVLNNEIANQVTASPGGLIESVKVLAGYNLTPGETLEGSVTSQGGTVHKLLVDLQNLAATRATQLGNFISMTNDAEQFTSMTAAEFGKQLPNWVSGGPSAGAAG